MIARDRARSYRRARRTVARGDVVISDRLPVPTIRTMDAPRCAALPGTERRPVARWLARRESEYYARMGPADVVLVLRVDPQVAFERRSDQDEEFITRRAAEVWEHDWSGIGAIVVDAGRSQEDVLAQVQRAVWREL